MLNVECCPPEPTHAALHAEIQCPAWLDGHPSRPPRAPARMAGGEVHLPRLALDHPDGVPDFSVRRPGSPADLFWPGRYRAGAKSDSAGGSGQAVAGAIAGIPRTDAAAVRRDGQGFTQ